MNKEDSDEKYSYTFETDSRSVMSHGPSRRISLQPNPMKVARTITYSGSRSSSVSLEDPFLDSPSLHWEENLSNFERRRIILQSQLAELNNQRLVFEKELNQTEAKIEQTAAKLHKTIDRDRKQLLSETAKLREETLLELHKAEKELDLVLTALQEYIKNEISTPFLVNGELNDINTKQPFSIRRVQSEFTKPEISVSCVKFKKKEIPNGNILGRVSMLDIDSSDPYVDVPSQLFAIGGQETVAGLTVMKSEIFVLRELSSFLDVYQTFNGAPVRRIKLENLRKPSDIVSHPTIDELYISDSTGFIYRLSTEDKRLNRWSVEGEPNGLHLWCSDADSASCSCSNENSTCSIFVTCYDSRMLREYRCRGEGVCLRSIRFTQDVSNPWHSIPLPPSFEPSRLLVCHGWESGKLHRVCHIDSGGRVQRSYGAGNGSGAEKMDVPLRMCVDQFGYVFVADRNNDRVLLLSPNLVYVRDIISKSQHRVKQPRRIFFDATEGRLYIGSVDGSIIAYQTADISSSTPLLTPSP